MPWVGLQCVVMVFPDHTRLILDEYVLSNFVFTSLRKRELVALLKLYSFYVCDIVYILVPLSQRAMGRSVICDCAISWSYPPFFS